MNPYKSLPNRSFWRPSVADLSPFDIQDLWKPKFKLDENTRVITYGSCFAQHIGRALKERDFGWHAVEKGPPGFPEELLKSYNYEVFSSRTGNIYTTSLLRQWCDWASGAGKPPAEYWQKDGRFIDPFRPNIEPQGFASLDEMRQSRQHAIRCFARSIREADVFVFTLGLTESWFNRSDGYEYPICPGTLGGEFDKNVHQFFNQDYGFVLDNLNKAITIIRELNPSIRFLLTVSPVPLVATNSGEHVLVATMHSKSVLRAVAGHLANTDETVDYFPSYEVINSPVFKGMFFEPNMRSVNPKGVNFVMSHFFAGLGDDGRQANKNKTKAISDEALDVDSELVCEEELLAAFSKGGGE